MPRQITAKCQSCGGEAEVEWTLGTKCPRCGSDKFYPAIQISRAQPRSERSGRGAASQKPITLILAVVLFIGGVSALVFRLKQTTKKEVSYNAFTMMCTNPDCSNPNPDRLFPMKFRMDDVFPQATCPFCKLKAAYRAVRCRNCETIFAMVSDGKTNPTFNLRCPQCGSEDIDKDSTAIPVEEQPEE